MKRAGQRGAIHVCPQHLGIAEGARLEGRGGAPSLRVSPGDHTSMANRMDRQAPFERAPSCLSMS